MNKHFVLNYIIIFAKHKLKVIYKGVCMKILLTGGGTAGHVMPHIAMLEGFRKNYDQIVYIGSKMELRKILYLNRKI